MVQVTCAHCQQDDGDPIPGRCSYCGLPKSIEVGAQSSPGEELELESTILDRAHQPSPRQLNKEMIGEEEATLVLESCPDSQTGDPKRVTAMALDGEPTKVMGEHTRKSYVEQMRAPLDEEVTLPHRARILEEEETLIDHGTRERAREGAPPLRLASDEGESSILSPSLLDAERTELMSSHEVLEEATEEHVSVNTIPKAPTPSSKDEQGIWAQLGEVSNALKTMVALGVVVWLAALWFFVRWLYGAGR